jgi:hypothetical protein
VQDGLRDKSAYVRKTAVLGCVKLFYVNETVIHGTVLVYSAGLGAAAAAASHPPSCREDCNIADTLYGMLHDKDSQVVANSVVALEEVGGAVWGLCLFAWLFAWDALADAATADPGVGRRRGADAGDCALAVQHAARPERVGPVRRNARAGPLRPVERRRGL